MRTPYDEYILSYRYGREPYFPEPVKPEPPPEPTRGGGESLETKVDILLRVFADQVQEIREEIFTEKYARYEAKMKAYEEGPMVKYEEAMVKWREWHDEQEAIRDARNYAKEQRKQLADAFIADFKALDDLGSLRYLDSYIMESLAGRFETIDDVRNATDQRLLCVNRVGPKTLKDIRMRVHQHTWETFTTDSGRSGQYCDGCKARTGFVAC